MPLPVKPKTDLVAPVASPGGASTAANAKILASGTLTDLTATTASIKTLTGTTVIVRLLPTTAYTARSQQAATHGLQAGDYVVARGRGLRAATVVYDTAPFTLNGVAQSNRLAGTVAASDTNSLTLNLADGTSRTVRLLPTTQFRFRGGPLHNPAPLMQGLRVSVQGHQRPNGLFVARVVTVLP